MTYITKKKLTFLVLGSAESENSEYKNDSRAANLRHQTIGHPQVSKHPENIN